MLAGNVVALLSPIIFVPILTYAFGPQNYDYKTMAMIRLSDDTDIAIAADTDLESIPGTQTVLDAQQSEKEQAMLKRASVIAKSMTVFLTIALLVLWPMPLYGTGYGRSSRRDFSFLSQVHSRTVRHVVKWPAKETGLSTQCLPQTEMLTLELRLVFRRKYFTGWVVVGIWWLVCSAFVSFYRHLPSERLLIVRLVRRTLPSMGGTSQ